MKAIKTLMIGAVAAVSLSTTAMASNLTIKTNNVDQVINVMCGKDAGSEKDTGYPINPGQDRTMAFLLIKIALGSDIWCDFFENGTDIGTAHFLVGSTAATVAFHENKDPAHFDVAIAKGDGSILDDGVTANDIHVTLTKKVA